MVKGDILNFSELVNGAGNQMRYVHRFSGSRRLHNENIAEHSFFTAFFSLVIGQHVMSRRNIKVNLGRLVQKALLHDIEEQFTGDIVRPVKHSTKAISDGIEDLSKRLMFDFFSRIDGNEKNIKQLYNTWRTAKDKSIEGKILAFADFVSVLSYLNQEVRSGNRLIMDTVKGLWEYYNTFRQREYDFLSDLVRDCDSLVNYLHPKGV